MFAIVWYAMFQMSAKSYNLHTLCQFLHFKDTDGEEGMVATVDIQDMGIEVTIGRIIVFFSE